MILPDTSVWVDHLRSDDPLLLALLDEDQVLSHPFVTGEVALGGLKPGSSVMRRLDRLEKAVVERPAEVSSMIEADRLAGTGIRYVDAGLLASARLTGCRIWTRDGKLAKVASRLKLGGGPPLH